MSREPYKKKWENGIPSQREIDEGRSGFIAFGLSEELDDILSKSDLFGLTVGPRTEGANTVPRCNIFIDELSYDLGYDSIACIDITRETCRLLLRPFGRGLNRIFIFPEEHEANFTSNNEGQGWVHLYLSSEQDREIAVDVLRFIKEEYQKEFIIPNS